MLIEIVMLICCAVFLVLIPLAATLIFLFNYLDTLTEEELTLIRKYWRDPNNSYLL